MLEPGAEEKVLQGQQDIEAYRLAHAQLHSEAWYSGVPKGHTSLLETLITALEKSGFTSTELEFEAKKNEVLAKFFAANEQLNIQELGFVDREDFFLKTTQDDLEQLMEKWA